jgi:hypothetical protein
MSGTIADCVDNCVDSAKKKPTFYIEVYEVPFYPLRANYFGPFFFPQVVRTAADECVSIGPAYTCADLLLGGSFRRCQVPAAV